MSTFILADENIDKPIIDSLRQEGFQVIYIAEFNPGLADIEIFQKANEQKAILLTADKDFGEIVYRQKMITSGVCLVRLSGLSPHQKAHLVTTLLKKHIVHLHNSFAVIHPTGIRIRKTQ